MIGRHVRRHLSKRRRRCDILAWLGWFAVVLLLSLAACIGWVGVDE